MHLLPLEKIVPDPTQPRRGMTPADLESLVESIRARGLLLPLRVKPPDAYGKHSIVSGHRRHAALKALGVDQAQCIIVDGPLDEATILAEQFAENVHREGLSPIDEAQAYHRYISLRNVTAAQAAKELNVQPSRISRLLPLLVLPEEFRAKIHDGTIPQEIGYYVSRLQAGEERDRLVGKAMEGQLRRDEAAQTARTKRPPSIGVVPVGRITCKLGGGRTLTLTGASLHLDVLIETLETVLKEATKARRQGLDVSTLARVLRDKAATGGGS